MSSPVPTTDPQFPSPWLPLAETICERYYAEFPDHDERYGARGRAFCAHDNAYLLAWFVEAIERDAASALTKNVQWLRALLAARSFPMDAFERNLELVAQALAGVRPNDTAAINGLLDASRQR